MRAAGLNPRIDEAGNITGKRSGSDPGLPVLVIGSHMRIRWNLHLPGLTNRPCLKPFGLVQKSSKKWKSWMSCSVRPTKMGIVTMAMIEVVA